MDLEHFSCLKNHGLFGEIYYINGCFWFPLKGGISSIWGPQTKARTISGIQVVKNLPIGVRIFEEGVVIPTNKA